MKTADALVTMIVLVTSVVGVVGLRSRSSPPVAVEIPDAATVLAGGAAVGREDAPYLLGVFTDYQCPACLRLEQELALLQDRLGDSLRIHYRHLPAIGAHPNALTAAVAAECARTQDWFPNLHLQLVVDTARVRQGHWREIAEAAEVPDILAFEQCLAARTPEQVIWQTIEWARAVGFRGTPTVVIGNEAIVGGMPAAELHARLQIQRSQ